MRTEYLSPDINVVVHTHDINNSHHHTKSHCLHIFVSSNIFVISTLYTCLSSESITITTEYRQVATVLSMGGGRFPQTLQLPPPQILPIEILSWHSLHCEKNNSRVTSVGVFTYSSEYTCLGGCVNSQHTTITMYALGSLLAGQLILTTQTSVCDNTATSTPKTQNDSKSLSEGSI